MTWNRRDIIGAGAALSAATVVGTGAFAASATADVTIDLGKETGALDHIWSRCAGSDRAAMTLREDWRNDLTRFHKETGLERVRFHGIFADELGVWRGGPTPNFQNIDAVYDGLLDRGVQPYVELSFMPGKLASGVRKFGFYGANITPPADMAAWSGFITLFVRHLLDRYGKAEVRQWMFEVWNEPDLSFFFSGTQADYFQLYKATAAAVKGVDATCRVGGPSTSQVRWLPQFLAFCEQNNCPVDFVSTHLYAGDDQKIVFGEDRHYGVNDVIPNAMAMARAQIDASRFKGAELWLSEWSSDSPAMIAHVLTNCLPHCHAMSQWAMSSWFEEIGVPDFLLKEGDNGWGMITQRNIPKPAFNTYKLLHKLGTRRLAATGPALASRTAKGAAALVWNLSEVQQPSGIPGASNTRKVSGSAKRLSVSLRGAHPGQAVKVSYVDLERGSPFPEWRKLGSPRYPTRAQENQIRAAAELAPPTTLRIGAGGALALDLPPEGVALLEIA